MSLESYIEYETQDGLANLRVWMVDGEPWAEIIARIPETPAWIFVNKLRRVDG